LAAVLGVEKHATRLAVLTGDLSNGEAAEQFEISERTVRRWRADGLDPPSERGALELADRYVKGGRFRHGIPEALYDLAAAEVTSGTYFSTPLLWALAEVLGVARRDTGLAQAATELIYGGLRNPEAFIAAGLAEGRLELERAGEGGAERILRARAHRGLDETAGAEVATTSVNEVASEVGVEWGTARRWRRKDSPHAEANELNRLHATAFARFNASGNSRRTAEAEAFLAAAEAALMAALAGRRGSTDRDTLKTALFLRRCSLDNPTVRALKKQAPDAWRDFASIAPRKRRT
jgi:transposase